MPVKIEWKARFKKELCALSEKDQEAVRAEINRFRLGERVDLIRLDKANWRLKVGVWRVFITFSKGLVELLHVKRRTTTTYRKR